MPTSEFKREGTCRDDQRIFRYELILTLAGLIAFLSETRPVQATLAPGRLPSFPRVSSKGAPRGGGAIFNDGGVPAWQCYLASLIRRRPPLGSYSRPTPGALCWS